MTVLELEGTGPLLAAALDEAEEAGTMCITYLRAIERERGRDSEERQKHRADMAYQFAVDAARYARLVQGYRDGTVFDA